MHKRRLFRVLVVIIVFLAIWQVICSLKIYPEFILPYPLSVFRSFIDSIRDFSLIKHIFSSIKRIAIGYFISFILAFVLATFALKFRKTMGFLDIPIEFMRSVPPLSLIPLLILWFGIGEVSKTIVIVLASFFPMYLSFYKGFSEVDNKLIEVARSFNFNNLEIYKKVILPYSFSDILVGMRIGLGYSYRAIIGAELIAASSGIGYMIDMAKSLSQIDVVIMGILIIGLLGYISDRIFLNLINSRRRGMYEQHQN